MAPVAGELPAHQLGVVTGSARLAGLVLAMWHRDDERLGDQLLGKPGAEWMVATLASEYGLGRVRIMSWSEMLHDNNVLAGGLRPPVRIVIAVSPLAVTGPAMCRHYRRGAAMTA